MRPGERTLEERLFARHEDGAVGNDREDRDEHPREEAGFTHMYIADGQALFKGADADDFEGGALRLDAGAKFPRCRQGRLVVPAGRIAGQVRSALREGRGDDGALRETLGGRHLKGPGFLVLIFGPI